MTRERGLRLMFYDVSEKRPVGWTWCVGAWVYRLFRWFDEVKGVRSWDEALTWLEEVSRGRQIDDLRFWGHGSWGRVYIGGGAITHRAVDNPDSRYHAALQAVRGRFHPGSLVWFRTCGTFATELGHTFASSWARFLNCRVAGQTYLIHFWHSGTSSTRGTPMWPITEGVKMVDGRRTMARSGMFEPRTLGFWQRKIPERW